MQHSKKMHNFFRFFFLLFFFSHQCWNILRADPSWLRSPVILALSERMQAGFPLSPLFPSNSAVIQSGGRDSADTGGRHRSGTGASPRSRFWRSGRNCSAPREGSLHRLARVSLDAHHRSQVARLTVKKNNIKPVPFSLLSEAQLLLSPRLFTVRNTVSLYSLLMSVAAAPPTLLSPPLPPPHSAT